MSQASPQASILVPTHNKTSQLKTAVLSALSQSIDDIEVLIIGDGVVKESRLVIEELVNTDARVVFLDFPKGPHHGEIYRHEAICLARSNAIFYLCDDDLLLRDHVSDLLSLLEQFDFVQSLNGAVNPNGEISLYPGVLTDSQTLEWIMRTDRRYNSVSLTGTAHLRNAYLNAGEYWETTPSNEWPDHHQWRRMLRTGKFSTATSHRMTALQFPSTEHERHLWSNDQRSDEQKRWGTVINSPDAQMQIDELVRYGVVHQLGRTYRQTLEYHFQLDALLKQNESQIADLKKLVEQKSADIQHYLLKLDNLEKEHKRKIEHMSLRIQEIKEQHRQTVRAIEQTVSWRITAPLRSVRRSFNWGLKKK